MNLRAVDLNLLVIFDTLMKERHVTRAALKVPMSQPAMSSALSRLRLLFKDDLFIRVGGCMEPTARAIELSVGVTRILREAERLMTSEVLFDPASSDDHFTGRMSDLITYLVLPTLSGLLSRQAPGMRMDITHIPIDQTLARMESDQLDFAISTQLKHTSNIVSEPLFMDRLVCVMRDGHKLSGAELSMQEFLKADHLHVAVSQHDVRFVDNVLAEQQVSRRITLTIPHWLSLPAILCETDMISVISERLASTFVDKALVIKELPLSMPSFSWDLYWHKRNKNTAAHAWLREQIKQCCSE
ncbi:LysR family transcriptional regulator [Pseudomonas rhodesiae]|jgi:DNA-binding transcriptional LysR family regulator|uniref:LysR family transcriptional regulator n=1 Tax=Pseudomonas rhodesiae TaxID=76760 RepID=UPI000B8C35D0|nr:LysR family transcriptional regulator [Pseudomonas rhodesiae]OXS21024.1 LysR family transcriptional regulator [Pseudomonas fluorescens]OZO47988.1 LysR family transcriptional regulator [Pseudomonas fluorescens]QVM99602.1 LysR family transcriptional regulator [Pseudomonas rhodesiae]TGY17423.1 LysR family transcriptional regulator [Pseudomonas fluorescens]WLG37435.1 LysR family transcriptional regulator [Pseudomonas rhodesiae]